MNSTEPSNAAPKSRSRLRQAGLLVLVGIGVVYILNPGWGVFELLPDNLPIIGNLDEAGATALVIWASRELFLRGRSVR